MSEAKKSMFARFKNPGDRPLLRNPSNDWVEQAYIEGFEAGLERAAEIAESANGLATSLEEMAEQTTGWNRAAKAITIRIRAQSSRAGEP